MMPGADSYWPLLTRAFYAATILGILSTICCCDVFSHDGPSFADCNPDAGLASGTATVGVSCELTGVTVGSGYCVMTYTAFPDEFNPRGWDCNCTKNGKPDLICELR